MKMDNRLTSVEGQLPLLSPALKEINSSVKEESKRISAQRATVVPKEMEVSTKYCKSKGTHLPRTTIGSTTEVGSFKYEAFHIVVAKEEMEQPEDLFKSLKFFLIVGRFIGIIPYSGVFNKSYTNLYFYPKSAAAMISVTILIILTVNLILGTIEMMRQPKRNAYEIAKSARAIIQFLWSWLLYFNFLVRGKKFLGLFYYWAKTTVHYGVPDRHLKRDVILITLLILTSAILENAILHLEYFPALDHISGTRFSNDTIGRNIFETYYRRSHSQWSSVIPFHEIISGVAFIQHKCMLYGCNYMDIMIAVFSRAIYFKFKMLYKLTNEQLAIPMRKGRMSKTGKSKVRRRKLIGMLLVDIDAWTQMAYDHKRLCDLLHEMETFFSPLIFGSYAVNIFYICVQLLDGLTVDISSKSLVHSIYAPWSFLHIIMRIYVVSICGARVNSYAHQIRNVLQECPIDEYNPEISRLDKKVTTGPEIGFTGLGCYVVTKPFILKIISVVFTFEIVLLQGAPSSVTGIDC